MSVIRSTRAFVAGLFVWLLPLIVVAEYVGTTFGNTVAATAGLFVLFAGALWISPPEEPLPEPPRWLVWVGRGCGLLLSLIHISAPTRPY